MKHFRLHAFVCLLALFLCAIASVGLFAQTSVVPRTPLVGFDMPPYGIQDWHTYWYYNFNIADGLLGGSAPLTRGLLLDTTASQPACSAQTRGLLWTLLGSTDMLEQCVQVSGSSYSWVTAATGSHWYVGSGAPTQFYNNGDFYLDLAASNLYEQLSGSWVLQGNIHGSPGQGVPTGGTTAQVLAKNSNADYDTHWVSPSGGVWGTITGTLSSQTDLEAALNGKQASLGFTPENSANKDAASGYAGLDSGGKLKPSEAPTWNQSTTGTAGGLSANIAESQVTNLPSDLAAKLGQSYNPDWSSGSGPSQILNKPSIPSPSSSNPAMDGTAAPGTATSYARADHVHPTDTSREAVANKGVANGYAPLNGSSQVPLANIPAIPESQVTNLPSDLASKLGQSYNPDWTASSGPSQVLNKPTLGTAAALASSGNGSKAVTTSGLTGAQGAAVCQDGGGNITGVSCPPASGGVSTFNGRSGVVVPSSGDYTAAQVTGAEQTANKDAASGYAGLDSSSKLKTSEFPNPLGVSITGNAAGLSANIAESQVTNLASDLAAKLASSTYNPDWNASSGAAKILNKPTIPPAQVNSDWNAGSGLAQILNKPTLPAPSTVTPLVDNGAGSIGSSSQYALADHVHPTDLSRAADSAVVHNAGDESISGVKTFNNSPSVPDPMNPNDAADKNYVDSHAGLPDVNDQEGVQVTISVPTQIGTGPADIEGTEQPGTSLTVQANQDFALFVGSDNLLHCQLSTALGGGSCGSGGGGGSGAVWGQITGLLSQQTDLQTALNGRAGIGTCAPGLFATGAASNAVPCAQVQWGQLGAKPTFATVATSGNYNDLLNLPTLPSPASSVPLADSGTGNAGSSASYARADHVHPTDTTRAADTAVVHNTGNESVQGVKTFASSPSIPAPVNANDAATKAYVDAHSGTGGGGAPGPNYAASFTAQTSVTILGTSHGLQTKNLVVQCYDTASPANSIQPSNYTVNGSTFDVLVKFANAQSGYCVVNGSGPAVYRAAESSSSTWSITASTHGLGKYLQVRAYDSNGYEISPGSLLVDTSGNVTLSFAMPQAGSVVITQ